MNATTSYTHSDTFKWAGAILLTGSIAYTGYYLFNLNKKIAALTQTNLKLQTENSDLKKDKPLTLTPDQIKALEKVTTLEKQLNLSEQARNQLFTSIADLEKTNRTLNEDRKKLIVNLFWFRIKNSFLYNKINPIRTERDQLLTANRTLEENLTKLQTQFANASEAAASLRFRADTAERSLKAYKTKYGNTPSSSRQPTPVSTRHSTPITDRTSSNTTSSPVSSMGAL